MSMALTGKDTIIVDTVMLTDFADGDTASLEMPNNLAEYKAGKNGNVIIAYNAQGEVGTFTLRLLAGSKNDKYMSARQQEYINDSASFVPLAMEFIKRVGDGEGNVTNIVYQLAGGVIQKIPAGKENVEGDTVQAVSIYPIIGKVKRIMG